MRACNLNIELNLNSLLSRHKNRNWTVYEWGGGALGKRPINISVNISGCRQCILGIEEKLVETVNEMSETLDHQSAKFPCSTFKAQKLYFSSAETWIWFLALQWKTLFYIQLLMQVCSTIMRCVALGFKRRDSWINIAQIRLRLLHYILLIMHFI